jgi:hypothetical protein
MRSRKGAGMNDRRASDTEPERRSRTTEGIWVALITAGATLGVAVIGLFGAASTGAVNISLGPAPTEVRTVTVAAPTPSDNPTSSALASAPASSVGASARSYLRDLEPADGGYKAAHPTTLGQKQYYDSIGMYCSGNTTRIVWGVPLGSRALTVVLGIDSDAGGAAIGGTARVQFLDENGTPLRSPLEVAIGRPASISIPVQGKAQMQVMCTAHNPQTERKGYVPYFDIELADAAFVS